jgi:beta-lactamase class A
MKHLPSVASVTALAAAVVAAAAVISPPAVASAAATVSAAAPHPDADLRAQVREKFETKLKRLDAAFDGVLGAEFIDLTDGQVVALQADSVFPTASTIKVAILIELFRQAEAKPGLLMLQRPFAATEHTAGSGMARLIGSGSSLAVQDIAKLMINLSENTATNVIIDEVGMDNVNRLTASMNLKSMRLQRKMLESEAQAENRENVAAPEEAAKLMSMIARCEIPVGKASCAAIRQIMEIPQPPHPAKDSIPKDIPIAFKWGGMEGVSVGWGIVSLPQRPYVFAIMTTYGQEPQSAATVRAVSEAAFDYYSRLARANLYGARVFMPPANQTRAKAIP